MKPELTKEQIEGIRTNYCIQNLQVRKEYLSALCDMALASISAPSAEEVREACARVCDASVEYWLNEASSRVDKVYQSAAKMVVVSHQQDADAIRALDLSALPGKETSRG